MKTTKRRMSLAKETLRSLSTTGLVGVAGGASWPNYCVVTSNCSIQATCNCGTTNVNTLTGLNSATSCAPGCGTCNCLP